jgi:hypothetical protein
MPVHASRWPLTEAGHVLGAWSFAGGCGCDLVAALAPLPQVQEPSAALAGRLADGHLARGPVSANLSTLIEGSRYCRLRCSQATRHRRKQNKGERSCRSFARADSCAQLR